VETNGPTDDPAAPASARDRIRTPRAAAVAGIAFSLLLAAVFVLVHRAVPAHPGDTPEWLSNRSNRNSLVSALYLLPFAGIAFLWFIGVARDRIGEHEDRFFATVFLGSGLLFIAMLFAAAATASALLPSGSSTVPPVSLWTYGRRATSTFLTVYAMRMAAVFTISTTSIFARLGLAPRWLVILGYATAAVLLVSSGLVPWLEIIFPAWVLVLSIHILVASPAGGRPRPPGRFMRSG
jgi:hypothetical protein